jgi:hypothetical protein
MKLDWEITGEIAEVKASYGVFSVELFLNDSSVGFLNMNLETEKVDNSLDFESSMIFDFFDIAENFRGYKAFLNLLGIEVPKLSLAHWTPAKNSNVYVITDNEIELASSDRAEIKKACLNYNVFPGLALAESAINLSKLDRLILLWQYENNCLFEPDFKNIDQPKHSVIYVQMYKELRADTIYTVREHKTYFETAEQAEKFISVYDKEIKKIMGVI